MDRRESDQADEAEGHADEQSAEPDWSSLARHFAGEASLAERAELERWAADPGRREELAALRAWWEQAVGLPSAASVDAMWRRLSRQMPDASEARRPSARATRSSPRVLTLVPAAPRRRAWRRSAAVAAVLAALAAAAARGLAERSAGRRPTRAEPVAMREFVTKPGQRASIVLVDGSTVTLGVASTLRVRPYSAAGPDRRELFLKGEAVFDVAHDGRRPFLVHAAGAVTEDLGTRFALRAYTGDGVVRVVVAEGKVTLRTAAAPAGTGALLGPGDVGRLDVAGRTVVERGADTAAYLGWTAGRLVFREAPVGEVAAQLGRWYDVAVVVDSGIAGRRVTVNMPAGALSAVLNAVTVPLALRYSYDRQGRLVHIGP